MNCGKLLLLYPEKDDPISNRLLCTDGVQAIHVDEIADLITTADDVWRFSDIYGSIQAAIGAQFDGKFVVNRVFSVADTSFLARLKILGFTDRWAFIILKTLVRRASRIAHDIGVRGVSKSLLPLHLQWLQVQRAMGSSVATPKFSYAFADLPPQLGDMADPFQKSIWSFTDWQEERHLPPAEANFSRFFVERPSGTPVICYFLGDILGLIFPREHVAVDVELIASCASSLRSIFESEMGEALFYRESDGRVRFYSFSPYLHSAAEDEGFALRVDAYLKEHLVVAA